MGFLDSMLGGQNEPGSAGASPLVGIMTGLLAQCGGVQGLLNKFTQAGHGDKVASWIGTGENQPIAPDQVQQVVGSEQINAIAAKLGVDPAQAAALLAKFLPNVVDKLTPNGAVDAASEHPQTLAGMLPSLLQSFGGGAFANILGTAPAESRAAS